MHPVATGIDVLAAHPGSPQTKTHLLVAYRKRIEVEDSTGHDQKHDHNGQNPPDNLHAFVSPDDLIVGQLEKRTSGAKENAEKGDATNQNVPQRLKPHCKCVTCGTAEAVPLSKTDFFSTFQSPVPSWATCGTAEAVPLNKTDFFSTF